MARRTAVQIAADRERIVRAVTEASAIVGRSFVRVDPAWRASDVAALVADGRLVREVRREWDTTSSSRVGRSFGGVVVMQRQRAYVGLPHRVEFVKTVKLNDWESKRGEW